MPTTAKRNATTERAHDAVIAQALAIMASRLQYRGEALTSPQAVRDYLRLRIADREHEVFVGLFLDAQHRLIAAEELFRGRLTQTSAYPREVVKAALKHNAAAVIFAHDHPSGMAEPSRADELLTTALKQALALIDCRTLDHFVVGGTNVTALPSVVSCESQPDRMPRSRQCTPRFVGDGQDRVRRLAQQSPGREEALRVAGTSPD